MKKYLSIRLCALLSFCGQASMAQITLTSSPYKQDFNNVSAGLPTGWAVRTAATASSLGTVASLIATPTAWNSTIGNFRNVAAGDLLANATTTAQNASINRAIAVRQTASSDPGAAFVLQLSNTIGFENFVMNFKLESVDGVSAAGRTISWRVDYGLGSSPSTFGAVQTSPLAPTTTLGTFSTTNVTVSFGSVLNNYPGNVWIRIAAVSPSTPAGSGSRPTTAIDDVELTFSKDTSPPAFLSGYPKIDNIMPGSFELVADVSEPSKVYAIVLSHGDLVPNSLQVKLGQNSLGVPVPSGFSGMINALSGNVDYSLLFNGMMASTSYDVYVVAEDNANNLTPDPAWVPVTTGAVFSESFNGCTGSTSFLAYSLAGDEAWSCTQSGRLSDGIRIRGLASMNEDWLISPKVSLSRRAGLVFSSQFSFSGGELQLKISTDYTGSGNPNDATWSNLTGNFPTVAIGINNVSASDWTTSVVDLSAYAVQDVYLAFVYTSTGPAARWTLDDVMVVNGSARYFTTSRSDLSFTARGAVNSYQIKGIELMNAMEISAPSGFQISADNVTFGNMLIIEAAEANAGKTIFTRFQTPFPATATFNGEIIHRSTGVAPRSIRLTAVDQAETFDVATYNLEFFGTDVVDDQHAEFGPTDDALQISNVAAVISSLAADVIAVQEVSSDDAFDLLVSSLPGYSHLLSDRWSHSWQAADPNFPPQKIGFIYNTSTVDNVQREVLFEDLYDQIQSGSESLQDYPGGDSRSFWASGRLPLMITADVTVKGKKNRVRIVVIHAKSGSAPIDFDRRKYDVNHLHDYLNAHHMNDKVILLGDFNDDVDKSISTGNESPYRVFVDDSLRYGTLTYAISQSGAFTFSSSRSFLDHIVVSVQMMSAYISNSITIANPEKYINNYTSTTSDHLPIVARFRIKNDQTIIFSSPAVKTYGDSPFELSGFASSLLPVTYKSSDPTVATITGNKIEFLGAGIANITASQNGDSAYYRAPDVEIQLTVQRATQSISIGRIDLKTVGSAPFKVNALSTSALPVEFSTATDKVVITGNEVTIVKAGRVIITATQPGGLNYQPASATADFCIRPSTPSVTISPLAATTLVSTATSGNQWYFNGSALSGATEPTLTTTKSGIYAVRSKADDCISDFSNEVTMAVTGNEDVDRKVLVLSPNPVTGYVEISGIDGYIERAHIIDASGRTTEIELEKHQDTLRGTVGPLAPGMYWMGVRNRGNLYLLRFIKE